MLIDGSGTGIETFPAGLGCSIPPFPAPGRHDHSLSVVSGELVACGGSLQGTEQSCIAWHHGQATWRELSTMRKKRYGHTMLTLDNEVLIAGGVQWSKKGEDIQERLENGATAETLDGDGFGILGQLGKYGACVVPFNGSEFLAIWGRGPTLVRYDNKGVVLDVINAHYRGTVPPIKTPRKHHACATYVSDQGEQGVLVTGGINPHDGKFEASTEIYLPSEGSWSTGFPLPRKLAGLKISHYNEQVVVMGGYEELGGVERDEILAYDLEVGGWVEIGKMEVKRRNFAVAEVNFTEICSTANGNCCSVNTREKLNVSLLHQEEGGIGKSIPTAKFPETQVLGQEIPFPFSGCRRSQKIYQQLFIAVVFISTEFISTEY